MINPNLFHFAFQSISTTASICTKPWFSNDTVDDGTVLTLSQASARSEVVQNNEEQPIAFKPIVQGVSLFKPLNASKTAMLSSNIDFIARTASASIEYSKVFMQQQQSNNNNLLVDEKHTGSSSTIKFNVGMKIDAKSMLAQEQTSQAVVSSSPSKTPVATPATPSTTEKISKTKIEASADALHAGITVQHSNQYEFSASIVKPIEFANIISSTVNSKPATITTTMTSKAPNEALQATFTMEHKLGNYCKLEKYRMNVKYDLYQDKKTIAEITRDNLLQKLNIVQKVNENVSIGAELVQKFHTPEQLLGTTPSAQQTGKQSAIKNQQQQQQFDHFELWTMVTRHLSPTSYLSAKLNTPAGTAAVEYKWNPTTWCEAVIAAQAQLFATSQNNKPTAISLSLIFKQ